jgi:uncharacterized protein (TIGR00162 family)
MKGIETDIVEDAELSDPVLIEGLPGVGQVGKLAAEHLLDECDGSLIRRVHSEHFPPQVLVDDAGTTRLAAAEFYAVETEGRDLLILTGDHQAGDNAGHYRLAGTFLDIAEEIGSTDVYALGGVPTGEIVEEYSVLGAVSDPALRDPLESLDVEFRAEEPAGGIVGVSGLLLGLGGRRGLDCRCLMGGTSGYLVDPRSARVVLEVLEGALDFDLDYESLEDRAEEMEEVVEKIQEMESGPAMGADEDLRYIG